MDQLVSRLSADTTEKDEESVWSVERDVIRRSLATSDLTVNFTLQCVSFSHTDKLSIFAIYLVFNTANAKALSVVSAFVFGTAYLSVALLFSLSVCVLLLQRPELESLPHDHCVLGHRVQNARNNFVTKSDLET